MNQLPFNAEAEQAVLASILLAPQALYEIDLEPREFFLEKNARLFALMKECAANGETPDIVTLAARSKNSGEAVSYLSQLSASIPSPSLVYQYANVVRRTRLQREIVYASTLIADMALNDGQIETGDLLPQAMSKLLAIEMPQRGTVIPIGEAILDYVDTFEQMLDAERVTVGIETGLDIDRYISGLIGGDLTLVAGEPGKGKTSLAMQVGFSTALKGHRTGIFSLEMAKRQYMLRLFSTMGNVNSEDIKRGKIRRDSVEYGRIMDGVDALRNSPLWIVDTPQTTDSIRAHLSQMEQRGEHTEFLVIDYLDMLTDRDKGEKDERVNNITRACKQMARQFDCCIWLVHALNRKDEISLRSLKYGGGYDADEVIICAFEDARTDQSANLHIVKNRNGDTCIVPMVYRGEVTRWDNPSPSEKGKTVTLRPYPKWEGLEHEPYEAATI